VAAPVVMVDDDDDDLPSTNGKGKGKDSTFNFDLTKLRYGKIVIMADADVDGSHIRTLLLTFFMRYLRPLMDLGNIYIAQPPLFGVKHGNSITYAQSEAERDRVLEEYKGRRGVHVQRYKGLGEMNADQLAETTMSPDTRAILQVLMEDSVRADHIVSILMGDAVEPRKNYITEHARRVKNLDI
jgi:DNA gyrase subunit B